MSDIKKTRSKEEKAATSKPIKGSLAAGGTHKMMVSRAARSAEKKATTSKLLKDHHMHTEMECWHQKATQTALVH